MIRVTKHNQVDRGGRMVEYPFNTWDLMLQKQFIDDQLLANPILSKLAAYTRTVFIKGYPERGKTVSSAPKLVTKTERVEIERITDLARLADYQGKGSKQHDIVQEYFMRQSPYCVATELPVFNDDYSGRIDIIEYQNEVVKVYDFKPNAHKETKAASQVKRYMHMLSERTSIPLSAIEGFYFDDQNIYKVL